jgi:hypothetical protein
MTALVIALVQLSFSMRGDRARGWPVKTKVALVSPSFAKEWTIDAGDVRKPVSLSIPAGSYKLTIAAEHHRVFQRAIEIADKDLSLPEIALTAIPAISGRVVAREKNAELPLAGAQVMAGPKQLATTNEQGLFRMELYDDPPPDLITVVHTGQAPAVVPLYENLAAENELGTIELPRGVTLTVVLDRRYNEKKLLRVTVAGKKTSASRDVKPSEDEVPFSGIAPGDVQVIIKGSEPLELMNETVEVHDEDLEHKIIIAPFRLDGRVTLGNDALHGGGTMEIASAAGRAQVPLDDDGRFGGMMWQTGKVTGWLKTPANPTAVMEISPELGSDPSPWNVALKRRFIEGHVVDAATKEPVPKAHIEVVITAGDRRSESAADVAKDGSFSIPAMQNGRYDLRATAAEHADQRKLYVLGRDDESKTADFALEGGVEVEVWCIWPNNQPAAGARVISDDGRLVVASVEGRAVLRLRAGEIRRIAVVPRQGSFAMVEVGAPRSGAGKPVLVIVPQPAGSIRIKSALRTPVSVSYNSREIPAAVIQLLRSDIGESGVMRLVHLPPGDYGVSALGARWVQVHLDSGEQSVELVPWKRPTK